jgi:hypothetical protein
MDRGRVARSIVDRRWHGPKAQERGGTLTGAWPPATPEHGSSLVGAQQREGNTGNSARAAVWRPGDDGETVEERKLGNNGTRASKEGESEMGEVR